MNSIGYANCTRRRTAGQLSCAPTFLLPCVTGPLIQAAAVPGQYVGVWVMFCWWVRYSGGSSDPHRSHAALITGEFGCERQKGTFVRPKPPWSILVIVASPTEHKPYTYVVSLEAPVLFKVSIPAARKGTSLDAHPSSANELTACR